MTHFIKAIIVITGIGLALQGCYPQGPEFTDDYDLVLTYVNDDYDFKAGATYALPDKIVKVTGNMMEGDDPVFIPDAAASVILAQISSNMEQLGWQRVAIDDDPDLLLAPASWESTTLYYYYDYWYWWWGGFYPGWGYPPVYASGYSTGTLVMGLIDPSEVGANGNPVLQWTGALNGLLSGEYNERRVNTAIDKAFAQSPYLKTN